METLEGSTFPWAEKFPEKTLRVTIGDYGVPTGGWSGLYLRSGDFMNASTIAHELGHVLDAWLLNYNAQQAIRHRFCQHDPLHPWVGTSDVSWAYRIAEDFANAYAFLFHDGMRGPGAGHYLTVQDQVWLKEFLLALEPEPEIWI